VGGPDSASWQRRCAQMGGQMGLLLASVILALGAAEWAIRVAIPQQLILIRPGIWIPHDGLGWVVRSGLNTRINTGERMVDVFTDEDGFRIGAEGRRSGDLQILLLGDSFMQALQVEHEQSFAGLIESQLSRRLHRPVAVRNAGVDGWGPSQYRRRAADILDRQPIDLVVVAVYLGNDLVDEDQNYIPPREATAAHSLRLPRSFSRHEWIDALLHPLNDYFETRSHLFILVKTRLRAARLRLGMSAAYVPYGVHRSDANRTIWEVTARLFAEIDRYGAQRGSPTVFVLIPPPFAVDPSVFREISRGFALDEREIDASQPNRLLAEALRRRHLTVISAQADFERANHAGVSLYGRIDRHLSPAGHEQLYHLVEPLLIDTLRRRE
jgi:hypothetical protein